MEEANIESKKRIVKWSTLLSLFPDKDILTKEMSRRV